MAFVGKEQCLAETPLQRRLEFGERRRRRAAGGRWSVRAKRSKSLRSRACATTSEPLNGVSGNSRRHRSSARRPSRLMIGSATSLSHYGASMPPAQWLVESIIAGVAALVQRDGVAGLREQQRLPRAGNACADDGNGGFPPRSLSNSGTSLSLRRHDPDQVQRVTAVSRPAQGLERAVSQLLVGAPLGTSANVGRWRGVSTHAGRERTGLRTVPGRGTLASGVGAISASLCGGWHCRSSSNRGSRLPWAARDRWRLAAK